MAHRVIRDDILTSDRVNALSWQEEVFFRRLMSIVDDYGRTWAHPMVLVARCFPLRTNDVSPDDIQTWLASMARHGLIAWYEHNGKPYLEILRFNQQVRIKRSEFPAPPDNTQDYIERYIDPAVRREILARGRCATCGATEDLTVDHVIPVTKGGKGDRENLECLCRSCNSRKGTSLPHGIL